MKKKRGNSRIIFLNLRGAKETDSQIFILDFRLSLNDFKCTAKVRVAVLIGQFCHHGAPGGKLWKLTICDDTTYSQPWNVDCFNTT